MDRIKETAINYCSDENFMTIYTQEKKWINKIYNWKTEYPNDVEIRIINRDGSIVAHIPKSWFKISPSRKRNMSEEQRAAIVERLKKYRESKKE